MIYILYILYTRAVLRRCGGGVQMTDLSSDSTSLPTSPTHPACPHPPTVAASPPSPEPLPPRARLCLLAGDRSLTSM